MAIDETGLISRTLPVVTTLPASPVEGQEVLYIADDANSILWHLKYRGAASGLSKWESVGAAPPLYATIDSADPFSPSGSNAWQNAINSVTGPDVIVPLAGVYGLWEGAVIGAAIDGQAAQVGASLASVDPTSPFSITNGNTRGAGVSRYSAPTTRLAAGNRIRMMYRDAASSGTTTFSKRWLAVIPIRVG